MVGKTKYSVDPKNDDITKKKHNNITLCIVFEDIAEKVDPADSNKKITISKKVMFST